MNLLLEDQNLACLFFIGTSAEMGRREAKAGELLEKLLATGLEGRLKEGDHFGIVAYGRDGYQVILPPAVWQKQDAAIEGKSARESLRLLRYEGVIGWANVAPLFSLLMRQPHPVHTIILSDGIEPFYGTQWDSEIQAAMAAQRVSASVRKAPVVLRLTGANAAFSSWAVAEEGGPVPFPAPPKPQVKASVAQPTSVVSVPTVTARPAEQPVVAAKAVQIELVKPPAPVVEVARKTETPPAPPQPTPLPKKDEPPVARAVEVARKIEAPVAPVATPAPIISPTVAEPVKVPAPDAVAVAPPAPTTKPPVAAVARELAVEPKPAEVAQGSLPQAVTAAEPAKLPAPSAQERHQETRVEAGLATVPGPSSPVWPWVAALILPLVGLWYFQRSRRSTPRASLISQSVRNR